MSTDWYPDEEGVLVDGLSLGWCIASSTITALGAVKLDTATAGNIVVTAAADFEGIGIAMRGGSSSDYIPILLYGVVKQMLGNACLVGNAVGSGTTAGYVLAAATTIANVNLLRGINYTGTVEHIGKALQGGTTGAEILVLVAPL